MREIIFDTETTGLDPLKGDRLVEIGCVEVIDYIPTGKTLHFYLNPERAVPPDATRIHGLTDAFLADKPKFVDIADAFLDFIEDSPLVAHNANFDLGFMNAELSRINYDKLSAKRVIDTLPLARKKFPGTQNNLDALCSRLNIDTKHRNYHGALLDAELLAAVYLELKGGRQRTMEMTSEISVETLETVTVALKPLGETKRLTLTEKEVETHLHIKTRLGDKPLWGNYS
jgi:DNA polymerase III subunit epsilon